MPELPEVEALTRSIRPILVNHQIKKSKFFRPNLRNVIPVEEINQVLSSGPILSVERRSKYMLWQTAVGRVIVHLGMTGNVVFKPHARPDIKHTHAVFTVSDGTKSLGYLHYIDPRRFGIIDSDLGSELEKHPLFAKLGPEPLEIDDLGGYLFRVSRGRKVAIKTFIMNAHVVVGVGNIYASEALFKAKINPERLASTISKQRMVRLAAAIQETLQASIDQGGTTFRDFKNSDGKPGYFEVELNVYGRDGQDCKRCKVKVTSIRQTGRSTFFCPGCQT